ncbi:transcriptional regulator [Algibacter pectinivorans]|uniref:Fur family transcriptional regulator, ferric uptake regulator n=1 Tax=Algibacter pectinivorans TaxID=870482 RepID=A0A1I1RZQ0_9FLAO|nr:Fur family transcriptional regulator, ferric uptake regulator [Algibacter pectinivorans]
MQNLEFRLNNTTIYRVLNKLEDNDIFHLFIGANRLKCCATCNNYSINKYNDLHPHFQCMVCGKVDCLRFKVKLTKLTNRKIDTSKFIIKRKCETCYNKLKVIFTTGYLYN